MIISETRQVILGIYGGEISRKKPVTERVLDQLSESGRPSALRLLSFSSDSNLREPGCLLCPFPFSWNRFSWISPFPSDVFFSSSFLFLEQDQPVFTLGGGQGICPMSQGLDWQCEGPVLAASLEGLMCPDLGKVTHFNILQQKLRHIGMYLACLSFDGALLQRDLARTPASPRPCSSDCLSFQVKQGMKYRF